MGRLVRNPDYSDAIRQIRRAQAGNKIGESLVLPAELVSTEAPNQYLTIRLKVPESSVASLKAVKPGAGSRAPFPFLQLWAADFPFSPEPLKRYCDRFLEAAAAGSVLVSAVEEMPAIVQDELIELLAGLELTRRPSAAVRLISGTTVSLLERVAVGTFSEQLFYRLNTIHLMASDAPVWVPGPLSEGKTGSVSSWSPRHRA